MTKILLKEKHLNILTSIFDKICPNSIVYAYGSRVKGEAHDGSDLDLAVDIKDNVSVGDIKSAVQDSTLPFLVDIFEIKTLPENFKKEIFKLNVIIYGA